MAHPFDPSVVGKSILGELNDLLHADVTTFVGFAERQASGLAKQAAWITEATIKGELNKSERQWFLDNLKMLSENFVRTLLALTILTIEKAWNAVVGVLWGAINSALKANGIPIEIPIPNAPSA